MKNKIIAKELNPQSIEGDLVSSDGVSGRWYLFGYALGNKSGAKYIFARESGGRTDYGVIAGVIARGSLRAINGSKISISELSGRFWDRLVTLGAIPVYLEVFKGDEKVYEVYSAGKIRVKVDSVEDALVNYEKERLAYSEFGDRFTVKLTEDWVRENFDRFILEDSKGLDAFRMERSKGELLRGLYRWYNKEYKNSVARSSFCAADCGVRETRCGIGYDDSIIPVREVARYNVCHNGVCSLINDVDEVFASRYQFIDSRISVLDLSKCTDIARVTASFEEGDAKRNLVMPSESSGFIGLNIKNLAIKGLSEIKLKAGKVVGGSYSGTGTVILENCTGLDKLDLCVDDLLCSHLIDDNVPVEISIKNTDLTELNITSNSGAWFELKLEELPNLRKLRITTDACMGAFQDRRCKLNDLPLLEELYIDSQGYENNKNPIVDLSRFKNLKYINLRICSEYAVPEYTVLIPRECRIDVYGCPCTVYRQEFQYDLSSGRR